VVAYKRLVGLSPLPEVTASDLIRGQQQLSMCMPCASDISCLHGASVLSIKHISPQKACTWQLPRMHTFRLGLPTGTPERYSWPQTMLCLCAARGPLQQVAALIAMIWVTACDIVNNGVCICPAVSQCAKFWERPAVCHLGQVAQGSSRVILQ
jgi:hypothetical protein